MATTVTQQRPYAFNSQSRYLRVLTPPDLTPKPKSALLDDLDLITGPNGVNSSSIEFTKNEIRINPNLRVGGTIYADRIITAEPGTQLVTLIGDVLGSGISTIVTNLASGVVEDVNVAPAARIQLSKLDYINEAAVVGRAIGDGSGPPEELTPSEVAAIVWVGILTNPGGNPFLNEFTARLNLAVLQ